MNRKNASLVLVALFASLVSSLIGPGEVQAARSIVFPVIGSASFSNDFNAPRSGGRTHGATDIFAPKHRSLVSTVDGVITFVGYPQPSYGYAVFIRDSDGYTYRYIHINNDSPGSDNGRGDGINAYAPDMKAGNPVVRGQHIGYVGDSGSAEPTPPHLHLDILAPNGSRVNPYQSLVEAQRIARPVNYPQLPDEQLPYSNAFKGGINIAMGNVDSDPESELISGAGQGGGPHVKVFDADDTPLSSFFAYASAFRGGVDVAAGDIDGDGTDEIITGAGPTGGPHVKVFELDGTQIGSFFAYTSGFRGGVRVAAGDIDGDGTDEIITGAGVGGGPHVKAFELDGTPVRSFFAYSTAFRGGVDVAAGDVMSEGAADEIITGAGPTGGPHVKVFDSTTKTEIQGFFAYSTAFRGGVRVSVGDVDTATPLKEILTSPAASGGPQTKLFAVSAVGSTLLNSNMFLESWWRGHYDIAAGTDAAYGAAGINRRATIRSALGPD